ncbi:MAG: hypothetical protein ABJA34_08060 [Pseudonocardiales bacterium]
MVRRGLSGSIAVALAALLAANGCSKDKAEPLVFPSASASPSPDPSFSRQDPVQAVLGFAYALAKAEETLDPNYPGLTTYGQGGAVADIVTRVNRFKSEGLRLAKPQVVANPAVTGRGFDKGHQVAEVTSCTTEPADDLVDAKTGEPRPPPGASQPAHSAMWIVVVVLMADGWHVDGADVKDVPSCPPAT